MPNSSETPKYTKVGNPVGSTINIAEYFGKGRELWTTHKRRWAFGISPRITEVWKEKCVGLQGGKAYEQNMSLHKRHSDRNTDVPRNQTPKSN